MAALMNSLERLSVTTGAAVAFAAHYSKGNQSGKEAIDRVGRFGRIWTRPRLHPEPNGPSGARLLYAGGNVAELPANRPSSVEMGLPAV